MVSRFVKWHNRRREAVGCRDWFMSQRNAQSSGFAAMRRRRTTWGTMLEKQAKPAKL